MAAKKRKRKGFRAAAARKARARKRQALLVRARKLNARRLHLNRGGYDSRGRYYGVGAPLYEVESKESGGPDGGLYGHVRARSAAEAKREALERPYHWGMSTQF